MRTGFKTAYDAGYDAGRFGANNFNSHYSWFNTKERMKEWQRGNDDGSKKREADIDDRRIEQKEKTNQKH